MNEPTLFDQEEPSNIVQLAERRPTPAPIDPAEALARAAAEYNATVAPRYAPVSRITDPDTSRQAAASISVDSMRETQRVIVDILHRFGPACDEDIAVYARQLASLGEAPKQSPSGLRSRRAELVTAGIVRDSGERAKTSSGRQTIVWELTAGRQ